MRIFGTSGLDPHQPQPHKPKTTKSSGSEGNPLKSAIREAIKGKNTKGSDDTVRPSQSAPKPNSKPSKPEAIKPDTLPKTGLVAAPKVEIGRALANSVSFGFRWMPFIAALGLAGLVLREVTDGFKAFGMGSASEPIVEKKITPSKPPIIYEQGIEPLVSDDDRVPVTALSDEYELNDPMLTGKLTGIGAITFGNSRCTASLLGRSDILITASHCIVEPNQHRPNSGNFKFYSPACDAWYSGTQMFVRTSDYDKRHDLDYAFLKLGSSVCEKAKPFQAMTLTDEAAQHLKERKHPLLALSMQPYISVRRHASFPQAWETAKSRRSDLSPFGVFCRFSTSHTNITSPTGSLDYKTEGCDEFGGASGGALVTSLDGGKTYQIIATLFGNNSKTKIGFYPRIKGEYAADLETFLAQWTDDSEAGDVS